jgi:HEPN domain-containing protein
MSGDELDAPVHYWLDLARGDLAAARVLAAAANVPPRMSAGFAQQAAEKALKALMTSLGLDPPRSHDLVAVAHRVGTAISLAVGEDDLRALTDAHAESRYPAFRGLAYDEADSIALVEIASSIVSDVERALGQS